MSLHQEYFKDKKITVMGLGLLGRGVGDTAFLAECGAEIIVTDMKSEDALKESIEKLSAFPNITYRLGGHNEEDFKGRDMILMSAGVPKDSPFILCARNDGAEIAMSGALFASLSKIPIIGITGTRGKSTVTHMIYHVLTQMTEGGKVILGGNVRGISNLQLLKEVEEDSIAVMELDSWQLQGFGEKKLSPHISVFTNFMEDHMNYYKGNMGAYFKDKANVFMYQDEPDTLVTTQEVLNSAEVFAREKGFELVQDIRLVDTSILPDDCLLTMPGEHNRLNAALALEALRAVGLTDEEIFEGLTTFPGVPGRLEYLGEIDGVKVYNDNNATTPTATVRGIEAVAKDKNVVLIAGGAYKEVDPSVLVSVIEKHCRAVVLLPGTGTDKLKESLHTIPINGNSVESVTGGEVLLNAVKAALAAASAGDVILFSPGFASFGMFVNEYERNDQFVAIIEQHRRAEHEFFASGFFYNEKEKSVLLHKRDNNTKINPNKWAFFGGGSEDGEEPVDTFVREIEEEIGVTLGLSEAIPLCDYRNDVLGIHRHVFFVRKEIPKEEMNLQEGADFDWVPLNTVFNLDLTDLTIKDLKFFIEKYVNV
ncbi:MAG: UDP-N-acetylmuramoyl-L-alanine--D-glutamate ligase [Candidatus Kaiserbacteria bacterium]|nr:UDP-N-acetylmuramoyl-L-alanine--D-glutamate ligase [Candidatus Kaiserbacteria bacterium]